MYTNTFRYFRQSIDRLYFVELKRKINKVNGYYLMLSYNFLQPNFINSKQ